MAVARRSNQNGHSPSGPRGHCRPRLPKWSGFPSATRLGHIHLTVGSLDASQSFYESLGLRLTSTGAPFASSPLTTTTTHVAINLLAGPNALLSRPTSPASPAFPRPSNLPTERVIPQTSSSNRIKQSPEHSTALGHQQVPQDVNRST